MLTRRALLRALDLDALEATISRVETRTSGELRISIAPLFWGSVRRTAERAFARLELGSTRERNAVLIFVAPARRRFVILGDRAIDALVGPQLWDQVSTQLGAAFEQRHYTDGLLAAIETIGEALALHFPADPLDNPNELPNTVDFG